MAECEVDGRVLIIRAAFIDSNKPEADGEGEKAEDADAAAPKK